MNVTKSAETADLVTFTEEILNGKLHFLRSERYFVDILLPCNKTFMLTFPKLVTIKCINNEMILNHEKTYKSNSLSLTHSLSDMSE